MRGKTFWNMVWKLVSPILLYLLLSISLTGVLGLAVPVLEEPENSMWLLALVNGFQIPVFLWLYRKESWGTERHRKESFGKESQTAAGERPVWKRSFGLSDLLAAALGGLLLARGFNGLIGLTPLPRLFPAYESVTEAMYGGSLLSQTLASVVTAPILEELLTRGLVYGRLRPYFTDPRPAVLLGALIFALFHGNVVQGTYAFFLGLYFVSLYETYHSLLLPILAHAAANASSILLEQTDWLDPLYADLPAYFLTTAVCLAAGAACWRRAAGKISSD